MAEADRGVAAVQLFTLEAAAEVAMCSIAAAEVELRLFAEDLTSVAGRMCACVRTWTCANGGEVIAGAIVTAIADRVSAFTSREAVVGVIGTIGAGA
jgi:hypothetical protein